MFPQIIGKSIILERISHSRKMEFGEHILWQELEHICLLQIDALKKSITEIESILEKVKSLKAYHYLYKSQDDSGPKTLGFMAQDVLPLFPELVGQAEDGYFALNYSGFGVVAIKAIQEQQEIIETQTENYSRVARNSS